MNGKGSRASVPAAIGLAGALVALLFCVVVYPRLAGVQHVILDPDGYGRLGLNMWQGYGLTFDPAAGATVWRGPLYPLFIALTLFVAGGHYPVSVWVAQSILHGLTCVFAYGFASRCWGRRVALVSGVGCAIYPVLFWYAPRMWNEMLLACLLTGLAYLSAVTARHPRTVRCAALGLLIGLLALVKATFLPFIIVLPLCLWLYAPGSRRGLLWIPLAAAVVIAPWTVRNYLLTGKVVPVHAGAGRELLIGNIFASHITEGPLAYEAIWNRYVEQVTLPGSAFDTASPVEFLHRDHSYRSQALEQIRSNPSLVPRKLLVAGAMFWYIGETPIKTIVNLALRIPVLAFAVMGILAALRDRRTVTWPVLALILVYWVAHTPFAPPSRLSVPVMPILMAFAAAGFERWAAKSASDFADRDGGSSQGPLAG